MGDKLSVNHMVLKIIYEDANLLVVEKPAGIDIEGIQKLLQKGFSLAHRLDKDTSGVLLIAKNEETLLFLRKQFQERTVQKEYLCLVEGEIKEGGIIETLLGRSPGDRRQQKVYLQGEPGVENKREARTEYKVKERFKGYTLLEVAPKTGRKHQIRVHFANLGHPIAGDKLYGFKNQRIPKGLTRQFLHAHSLRLAMPDGTIKEFTSELPEDLEIVLKNLSA